MSVRKRKKREKRRQKPALSVVHKTEYDIPPEMQPEEMIQAVKRIFDAEVVEDEAVDA